jgi:hypothetical protein
MLEHMWEEAQDDPSLAISVAEGYFSVLDIALAREDRAAADNAALVLERCFPIEEVNARALLAAYREDDPGLHDIAFSSQEWIVPGLVFLSEHGIHAPRTFISQVRSWPWLSDVVLQYVEIAEALEASDLARLAASRACVLSSPSAQVIGDNLSVLGQSLSGSETAALYAGLRRSHRN